MGLGSNFACSDKFERDELFDLNISEQYKYVCYYSNQKRILNNVASLVDEKHKHRFRFYLFENNSITNYKQYVPEK